MFVAVSRLERKRKSTTHTLDHKNCLFQRKFNPPFWAFGSENRQIFYFVLLTPRTSFEPKAQKYKPGPQRVRQKFQHDVIWHRSNHPKTLPWQNSNWRGERANASDTRVSWNTIPWRNVTKCKLYVHPVAAADCGGRHVIGDVRWWRRLDTSAPCVQFVSPVKSPSALKTNPVQGSRCMPSQTRSCNLNSDKRLTFDMSWSVVSWKTFWLWVQV